MKTKLLALAMACMLSVGALAACSGGSSGSHASESSAGSSEAATSSESAQSDSASSASSSSKNSASASGSSNQDAVKAELEALPEKFPAYEDSSLANAMSITVEGHTFQIPCMTQDFLNEGWQTEPPAKYKRTVKAVPQTVESAKIENLKLFKDDTCITVLVCAPGDEEVAWRETRAMGVDVEGQTDNGLEDPNFSTGAGIKLGMAVDEVTEIYGKPYSQSITSSGDVTRLVYKAKQKNTSSGIGFNTKYMGEAEIEISFDDSGNVKQIETWYGLEA